MGNSEEKNFDERAFVRKRIRDMDINAINELDEDELS